MLRWPIALCLVLNALGGCHSLQGYRPVSVLVRDAETKQPIPSAGVKVWYPFSHDAWAPQETAGMTDGQGVAQVEAVMRDTGIMVKGSAAGYLTEERPVSTDKLRAVPAGAWLSTYDRHAQEPDVVVEVFAEPRASVELIVPTAYRGVVKVQVAPDAKFAGKPGQRDFQYVVAADGAVTVEGPLLFKRLHNTDFRARYADGTSLDPQAGPTNIGLRWQKSDLDTQYFVVGTQSDLQRLQRQEDVQPAGSPRSGGGKKGGGRGRRRGGGGAPDS